MSKLAIISEKTVEKIVTRQLAFDAVQSAFEAVAVNRSQVFDVVIGTGLNNDEAFAIKSGLDRENELVGFKCGTYWARSPERRACRSPSPGGARRRAARSRERVDRSSRDAPPAHRRHGAAAPLRGQCRSTNSTPVPPV